jgi:hypothetical protein
VEVVPSAQVMSRTALTVFTLHGLGGKVSTTRLIAKSPLAGLPTMHTLHVAVPDASIVGAWQSRQPPPGTELPVPARLYVCEAEVADAVVAEATAGAQATAMSVAAIVRSRIGRNPVTASAPVVSTAQAVALSRM